MTYLLAISWRICECYISILSIYCKVEFKKKNTLHTHTHTHTGALKILSPTQLPNFDQIIGHQNFYPERLVGMVKNFSELPRMPGKNDFFFI